jgi:arylsulfatase A-like enzyme
MRFLIAAMTRRSVSAAVAIVLGAGAMAVPIDPVRGAVSPKPNVVVFYLDDLAVHDGRLWNSATRTPAIHGHFVARGTRLLNAIAETPQCCPARASLLTGLHSHNHGVMRNDARLFKPGEHLGKAMQRAGYATMYIGKYLNRNQLLSTAQWSAHERGWTFMDVIKGTNGAFTNYTLRLKGGAQVSYGSYHSTRMVAERAVARMRRVPATQPLFAVLSIYNTHLPNKPMPQFVGSAKCAGMSRWKPPNYNEADVSDKPAWVREHSLLAATAGWPMVRHCEEMLSVDWAVAKVTAELKAQGRLNNTLLVFTADNGMNWGAHRLKYKNDPYSTPIPLYMSWPARWGTTPRTLHDHVSNIDLAPTFCAVAGCTMGPYPSGDAAPDGHNLMPLLDGDVANVGRDAVLEQGRAAANTIRWRALRTTSIHPRGLWHYVEYATGERELYDLRNDPWELNNLARRAGSGSLMAELAERLSELRSE